MAADCVLAVSSTQNEPPTKKEDNGDDKIKMSQPQPPKPGKSPLFWVNSDPQTVQKGSREETLKRIRSHVMSEHNRKKRLENTRRYNKSKTWKNLAYRPEPLATSKLSRALESSLSSPSSSSTSDRSSSKGSSSPEIRETSPPDSLKTSRSTGSLASETSVVFSTFQDPAHDYTHDLPEDPQLSVISRHKASIIPAAPYIGPDDLLDPFRVTQTSLSETQYQHFKFCMFWSPCQSAAFINVELNHCSPVRPGPASSTIYKPRRCKVAQALGLARAVKPIRAVFLYHLGSHE